MADVADGVRSGAACVVQTRFVERVVLASWSHRPALGKKRARRGVRW